MDKVYIELEYNNRPSIFGPALANSHTNATSLCLAIVWNNRPLNNDLKYWRYDEVRRSQAKVCSDDWWQQLDAGITTQGRIKSRQDGNDMRGLDQGGHTHIYYDEERRRHYYIDEPPRNIVVCDACGHERRYQFQTDLDDWRVVKVFQGIIRKEPDAEYKTCPDCESFYVVRERNVRREADDA